METQLTLDLQKTDSLFRVFEIIHNFIYANDGLSPQQTLEQMMRVLFVKIAAEIAKSNQFFITNEEQEVINKGKESSIFTNRIEDLFERTKKDFSEVFDSSEKIKLSSSALANTVNKLQNISLTTSSDDAKGLAFQKFLANHEKGESGQFFTPEPVVNFCVQMLKPKPGEKIIDPSCGSGGFLLSSLRYLTENSVSLNTKQIISNHLFGLDINKSIAKIARMKLFLEAGASRVNIFCVNSLSNPDLSGSINIKNGDFDVLFANPPFGTSGRITNAAILSKYQLGFKWINADGISYSNTNKLLPNQVIEILFIERCLSLLKEGGRMAIILPNGVFENSSLSYVRDFIKQNAKVLAITNLPQETFIPYGTGVKTSILFLEKNILSHKSTWKIFFSRINKLGYQGNKNASPIYKKDLLGKVQKDGNGNLLLDEDLSDTVTDYSNFQKGKKSLSENSFALSSEKLNGRFDYDFYSPQNQNLITVLKRNKVFRLSEIAQILRTRSTKLSNSEKKVEYVELSDVNAITSEIINSTSYFTYELPSRATYEIQTNDIITSVAGNSIGSRKHATALVTSLYNGCICTNGFRVLREFKIDLYYLLFYFRTDFFLRQVSMYRTGATIPSISDADFANLLIYIPNDKEVLEISQQMHSIFALRETARKSLENIQLTLPN